MAGKKTALFLTFLKIGAFTFGGGYAMIPLIQREVSERRKWVTEDDILEIVAIAESTPGPIAVNAATMVGYRVAGFWGAFFSTLGVVLPSFLIILALSYLLDAVKDFRAAYYAFYGIKAAVLALLVRALWMMFRRNQKDWFSYLLMASAFALTAFLPVPVILVLIGCAILGLIVSLVEARRRRT